MSSGCSKTPQGTAETAGRSEEAPKGSPRSTEVTMKHDKTDVFGIPYEAPERDEAVAQYQRRSMHKLHIAEWHGAEFEQLEGKLTTEDVACCSSRGEGGWTSTRTT